MILPAAGRRALLASASLHGAGIAAVLAVGWFAAPRAGWTHADRPAVRSAILFAEAPAPLPPAIEPTEATVAIVEEPPTTVLVEPVPPFAAADELPNVAVAAFAPHAPEHAAAVWRTRVVPERTPPADVFEPAPVADTASHDEAATAVEASPLPGCNEPPRYPFQAWRRGVTGVVLVVLEVDAVGAVTGVRLERSSGSAALDAAALRQLATWRFAPARGALGPVCATFRQEVVFRLR